MRLTIYKFQIIEINLEKQNKIISDLKNNSECQQTEINILKQAVEELKSEKIKIFEEKSDIIEQLRCENEKISKLLNEQTRNSFVNESLLRSHEDELKVFIVRVEILEKEKLENEY